MTKQEAIKYLQQLHNGGHCWLDEQHIEAIAIEVVQEELISEELEKYSDLVAEHLMQRTTEFDISSVRKLIKGACKVGAKWKEQQMMSNAIDGKVLINGMGNPILHLWDKGKHLIDKKVKVLVIKEE